MIMGFCSSCLQLSNAEITGIWYHALFHTQLGDVYKAFVQDRQVFRVDLSPQYSLAI